MRAACRLAGAEGDGGRSREGVEGKAHALIDSDDDTGAERGQGKLDGKSFCI
jgi:hypothetical protein